MMKILTNLTESRRRVVILIASVVVCGSIVGATFLFSHTGGSKTQVASAVSAVDPFAEIKLTAQAAFVYDASSQKILFAKNAQIPLPLASVTKLMLATVVAEVLPMGSTVTISDRALAEEGDSGLIAGEKWNAQDLLDFTLIVSSNDGAEALADAAGSLIRAKYVDAPADNAQATIWRMNQKAKELGLTQTYYLDTNGLDSSLSMAGAYGSAYDMGILFTHMISHDLNTISKTTEARAVFASESDTSHTANTTNDALGDIPGLIAGKTGYTDLAGGNLVIAFDASIGHPIIVVVLSSTREGRFNDVQNLVKAAREAVIYP